MKLSEYQVIVGKFPSNSTKDFIENYCIRDPLKDELAYILFNLTQIARNEGISLDELANLSIERQINV